MARQHLQAHFPQLLSVWQQANRNLLLVVKGKSMRPLIRQGDRVEVRLMNLEDLKPGDIIAFREKRSVVVHRLLAKSKNKGCRQVFQKGDNAGNWSWVKSEHVLGRVDVVHGASRKIYLNRGMWSWLHPAIGLLAFGVTIMRKAGRFGVRNTRGALKIFNT
jgi:Peptidase S24-like